MPLKGASRECGQLGRGWGRNPALLWQHPKKEGPCSVWLSLRLGRPRGATTLQVLPFLKRLGLFSSSCFQSSCCGKALRCNGGYKWCSYPAGQRDILLHVLRGPGHHLAEPSSVKHTLFPRPSGRRSEGLPKALA